MTTAFLNNNSRILSITVDQFYVDPPLHNGHITINMINRDQTTGDLISFFKSIEGVFNADFKWGLLDIGTKAPTNTYQIASKVLDVLNEQGWLSKPEKEKALGDLELKNHIDSDPDFHPH